MSQTRAMKAHDRARPVVVTFGLVGAFLAAGYGVLFTVLDEMRDEYGITESALGVVIGVGFFAGFVAQSAIAPLADRGHARRLVLTGLLLNIAGLLLMAVATTIVPLLAGRIIAGLGVGMAVPAIRRIVILADPGRLGHNLGLLLAADVSGFAAGPAISALLVGPFGIPTPFVVIAVATAVALPFIARTKVTETADPVTQRFAFDLLRIRPFAGAVVLGSAVFLMIGAFDALWSLALDDLEADEWIANLGITLFALPLVLFGAVGGRLAQRVGPFRVGTIGLLLGALFMMLYGVMPTAGAMFAVAMVHAVSDGITVSSTGVAVGLVVPAERQAGAQGVLGGLQTLSAGVVAIIAGVLYEHAGRTTAYAFASGLMVVFVAVGVWLARGSFAITGGRQLGDGSADLSDRCNGPEFGEERNDPSARPLEVPGTTIVMGIATGGGAELATTAHGDDGASRRRGDRYLVSDAEKAAFGRDGFVHLRGVLSPAELVDIEVVYDRFLRGDIAVPGKDFNDMTTGEHGSDPSRYAIVNVMVPRRYHPEWQGNVFERRASDIAAQLCGEGMVIDFDQLLAKQPGRDDAVFGWHQDQAYWIDTDDRRTATCWLAVDASTVENGCVQFLPGSHREPVRPHHPLHGDRDTSHTLVTDLRPDDVMVPVPVDRGDITVHSEGVLHGSGGNSTTDSWRRAYIVAFRSASTVQAERELGFTHSHNDDVTVLERVDGLAVASGRGGDDEGEGDVTRTPR